MDERSIAVFIDFENLALGVRDLKGETDFRIGLILNRLLEKGRLVYKRAYSDWNNYRRDMREFHSHGIELIDIPQTSVSGKNSADIRMVVDAIDLCHTKENIDTFALVSGDSDFSPLVSKLKENDKRVIGCGIRASTSDLLVHNCDEFIYYDDLVRAASGGSASNRKGKSSKKSTAKTKKKKTGKAKKAAGGQDDVPPSARKVLDIIRNLQADYDPLWGSMVKQTVRRVHPGFQEGRYGYSTFADLLLDLEDRGYIELEYDESRGNYKVWTV